MRSTTPIPRLTRFLQRFQNLGKRSLRDIGLLIEAFVLLGIARLAVVVFPFKKLARILGWQLAESAERVENEQLVQAKRVAWAVARASEFTPWLSNCLPQAMAAQILLRQSGIGHTLYLGTASDESAGFKAHAWVRCGPYVVTGGPDHRQYAVVARFSEQDRC